MNHSFVDTLERSDGVKSIVCASKPCVQQISFRSVSDLENMELVLFSVLTQNRFI